MLQEWANIVDAWVEGREMALTQLMKSERRLPRPARDQVMARSLRPSAVAPSGMLVQDVQTDDGATVIAAGSATTEASCPACGAPARRVHSRYVRTSADLPLGGRPVQLKLMATCSCLGTARWSATRPGWMPSGRRASATRPRPGAS